MAELGRLRAKPLPEPLSDVRVRLPGLRRRRVAPGPDRPDGLVGDHQTSELLAGEPVQPLPDLPVKDVELDELWSFIRCKEAHKERSGSDDPREGDSYTFLALERTSKLIVTWHMGRRTAQHCDAFVEKLDRATSGRFQLSSDGFSSYPGAVGFHLGTRTDYAVLVKEFGGEPTGERRYSPGKLTGTEKTVIHGNPDPKRISTSYIERMNLSVRTHLRRWTRLTCAFSKCWENHKAAMSLFLAHYNFCRMHQTLRMTPAMAAELTRQPWSLRELLTAATAA